jgi:hypothetical protein
MPMCNCIRDINTKLKEGVVCLSATMPLTENGISRALIPLIRLDKWIIENRRNKPKDMIASFCPWCGEKYPTQDKSEELIA